MRHKQTVWCDGCGVEITWAPQLEAELHYCCSQCFAGRPCLCTARMELEADRRARVVGQATADGVLP
jgi:hypothetical protein